jgi:CubicO group peptidase (beta-lactamase class C family)
MHFEIAERAIRSIDDTAATYVPELVGTEYSVTPLRALLHMSSGGAFRETYQPGPFVVRLNLYSKYQISDFGGLARWRYQHGCDHVGGTHHANHR